MTVNSSTSALSGSRRASWSSNPAWRLSFPRLVRSEWIKLFSLRSTVWLLAITIGVALGLTAIVAGSMRMLEGTINELTQGGDGSEGGQGGLSIGMGAAAGDLSSMAMPSLMELVTAAVPMMGVLVFSIVAVMMITNEYSSGMIRSTWVVAPRRKTVLTAKLLVLAVVTLLAFGLSLAGGFLLGRQILHGSALIDLSFGSATDWRIAGGFLIEMVATAALCLGLGMIVKSTAGSIGACVALLMVIPGIFSTISGFLPDPDSLPQWQRWLLDAGQFLPTTAGSQITVAQPASDALLQPWAGLGVLGIWAVAALAIGFIVSSRRDV
ncbi:MAG: ABC transporter permease [Propionibacteriaceae bacterium]|nr:ABC transporter permease [Propionibacteriaceae bacterium]